MRYINSAGKYILGSAILISSIIVGCGEEKTVLTRIERGPAGTVLDLGVCGRLEAGAGGGFDAGKEYFRYRHTREGRLELDHINTGLNCCTTRITSGISVSGDTITISETGEDGLCDCVCLSNVYYEITRLKTGKYNLIFEGLYVKDGDLPLTGSIDLADSTSGTGSIRRDYYPWQN
ncbi:MAG: hypothetical protein GF417_11655 [Candidatus Latescibacteria bacterium]|nr:hypothetical protein [bacterium]MBD3425080.1 hypothetical protein [Candidatus Latescibacterota bacterium]